jgi:hypothetical protein
MASKSAAYIYECLSDAGALLCVHVWGGELPPFLLLSLFVIAPDEAHHRGGGGNTGSGVPLNIPSRPKRSPKARSLQRRPTDGSCMAVERRFRLSDPNRNVAQKSMGESNA